MTKLTKPLLMDLALNMVRMINAQVSDEMLSVGSESLEHQFITKTYKVSFVVEHRVKRKTKQKFMDDITDKECESLAAAYGCGEE